MWQAEPHFLFVQCPLPIRCCSEHTPYTRLLLLLLLLIKTLNNGIGEVGPLLGVLYLIARGLRRCACWSRCGFQPSKVIGRPAGSRTTPSLAPSASSTASSYCCCRHLAILLSVSGGGTTDTADDPSLVSVRPTWCGSRATNQHAKALSDRQQHPAVLPFCSVHATCPDTTIFSLPHRNKASNKTR